MIVLITFIFIIKINMNNVLKAILKKIFILNTGFIFKNINISFNCWLSFL